jgi:hypothetical protein
MADVYLLSQAQYFLGSKQSSFSTLMLNVIVAKTALRELYQHTHRQIAKATTAAAGQMPSTNFQPYAWGILPHKIETEAIPCTAYSDPEVRESWKYDFCTANKSSVHYQAFSEGACTIRGKRSGHKHVLKRFG